MCRFCSLGLTEVVEAVVEANKIGHDNARRVSGARFAFLGAGCLFWGAGDVFERGCRLALSEGWVSDRSLLL